jgi:hypothetical protein
MIEVLYLSLVTASVSFTVTETKLFKPMREWVRIKSVWGGDLVSCGYCFGHWVALALVIIYQPQLFQCWYLLDLLLTALVVAWLAGFQWALLCLLMLKAQK